MGCANACDLGKVVSDNADAAFLLHARSEDPQLNVIAQASLLAFRAVNAKRWGAR